MYDYIIIGGGIAGLYANYLLRNKKTLLLEKNKYIGGRGIEIKFHNKYIKLGAGIGEPQNKHLLKLLKKIKIKYHMGKGTISYNFESKFNINKAIKQIIKKYKELKSKNNNDIKYLTIKQFIIKYFGKKFFKEYDKLTEYNDYHNFDITYFIKYYKIQDQTNTPYNLFYLSWTELINKLKKLNPRIKTNFEVKSIKYITSEQNSYYLINNKIKTKNIITALTVNTLDKIIQNSNIKIPLYKNYIGTIPFMRIYTYHKDGHKLNINHYTILDNILEKLIFIDDKILMISYNDDKRAIKLYKMYKQNKNQFITKLEKYVKSALNQDIKIDDIVVKYWDEGIHYIKPTKDVELKTLIKKLQNPYPNFYVCGEMLSYKQGWVEGSIESVNRIKNQLH
jgi:protoporphyrinogen oxidase